jgi:hypothetical protein
MIRFVFYFGSLIVINMWLYNQYLDLQDFSNEQIVHQSFLVDDNIKKAMRYHGLRDYIIIEDENDVKYYVFIKNGQIYNVFDYKQFPKLKKYMNKKEN